MDDCSDSKYNNQELSLDDQPRYFQTNSKISPMEEERYTAANRLADLQLHNPCATAPLETVLLPPSDNDLKPPRGLLENTIDKKGPLTKKTVRMEITRIPLLDKMPVHCLTAPFVRGNTILLIIPKLTCASAFVREAFRVVYTIFQSMAPELSFHPNRKDIRCRGYFTHDFDTCAFEAQIQKVHPSFAVSDQSGEHICELRRTRYGGRDAFNVLVRAVAVGLKRGGYAKQYANGLDILPVFSIDDDDLGETSNSSLDRNSNPISLDSDSVSHLSSLVAKRICPPSFEALRLMVKCSAGNRKNSEVLLESDELGEAVVRELSDGSDASSCLNALKLIELGATVPKKAFPAIVRSMVLYCGKKPSGYKGMSSQVIENSALGAIDVLMRTMEKQEREESARIIEKALFGKLHEKLFRKVQTICLQKH